MLEYVTYATTVTELPVGTRVAKAKGDDLLGTVTGTRSNSVGVRWDNGGTSYGPASHGLWIVAEDEAIMTEATVTATTYAHPGDKHECYPRNAYLAASQGKGIPRYTGPDCDREHVATVHALTFPAAVQALYAGDSYAAYIQASMEESVAAGRRDAGASLGELFIGNDGE